MEAKFLKNMKGSFTGDARLYELSKAVTFKSGYDDDDNPVQDETYFVVVSGIVAMFSGRETYIFPSDQDGNVLDWGELEGSFRGNIDHQAALANLGYEVIQ